MNTNACAGMHTCICMPTTHTYTQTAKEKSMKKLHEALDLLNASLEIKEARRIVRYGQDISGQPVKITSDKM